MSLQSTRHQGENKGATTINYHNFPLTKFKVNTWFLSGIVQIFVPPNKLS